MPLAVRQSKTATGKVDLIVGDECSWDEFPIRAQQVGDQFRMVVRETIDGLDERMWLAAVGEATFCISWDIWFPEVSIMAWQQTPEAAVRQLITGA